MKYLIVVDMQVDFVTGALGSALATAILPNVAEKVKNFEGKVIFTRDTHFADYLQTQEGRKLPVPHCIKNTKGWEIADGLYVEGCKIIDKPHFGWDNWSKEKLEDVELIGLCTDICVVSNALIIKATFPDANVTVDKNCCAGVTPETHEAAITTMKMCQIDIIGE